MLLNPTEAALSTFGKEFPLVLLSDSANSGTVELLISTLASGVVSYRIYTADNTIPEDSALTGTVTRENSETVALPLDVKESDGLSVRMLISLDHMPQNTGVNSQLSTNKR